MKRKVRLLIKSNPYIHRLARKTKSVITRNKIDENIDYDYTKYFPTVKELKLQQNINFLINPKISILLPTYNTNLKFLRKCIESVIDQTYENWELCIADDNSPDKNVVKVISEYIKNDKRIKLHKRTKNGHISAATNSAAKIATGDYYALLDHDDILWPNALFEMVQVLNKKPETQFIYTDEDKIDETGEKHFYPFFKPDWSPEFLESCNYITHFSCISKELFNDIGGFRIGYEGAQDWDLIIRATEKSDKIVHIPKVLYSWRVHLGSTAMDTDNKPYVYNAQKQLLVDHIKRIKLRGEVRKGIITQHSSIEYYPDKEIKIICYIFGNDIRKIKKTKNSIKNNVSLKNISITTTDVSLDSSSKDLINNLKKNNLVLFIKAGVILDKNNANSNVLVGDAMRQEIGVIGPRIMSSADNDKFVSAGLVYANGKFINSLYGIGLHELNGVRPLYGYSRRNVCAVSSDIFITKTANLLDYLKSKNGKIGIDELATGICIFSLKKHLRNIYSPRFVAFSEADKDFKYSFNKKDMYYNDNFSKKSANYDNKKIYN